MAQMLERPKLRNRNQAYLRAEVVRDVLGKFRHGATAVDVKSAVMDETGKSVGLDAIKASLWHLYSLELVEFVIDGRCRFWSLAPVQKRKASK